MKGIILGTSQFSHLNQLETERLLDLAIQLGINSIDTAPSYHSSEKKIGKFMKKNPGAFNISTKILRSQEDISIKSITESIEKSLSNLHINNISTLYVHGTVPQKISFDLINFLRTYQKSSITKQLGWCGVLPSDYLISENHYDVLMLKLNPWENRISSRIDLHSKFEINAMNIFGNFFWKYKPWALVRTFLNAHLKH